MFGSALEIPKVHRADGIEAIRSRIVGKSGKVVNRTQSKKIIQARQRNWLREVLETHGLKPAQLAAGAGASTSTLTRFLNDDGYTGTLAPETIERIKDTYRVPGPEEFTNRRSALIGLSEASRFDPRREPRELAGIVEAILRGRKNVEVWRLKTLALENAGYLPGDLVFVEALDEGQQARQQDAVCAHVEDFQHGSAETVWRVYDAPFLVGAGNDRTAYKPLLVDGDRVKIAGVIRESFRPHALSATR